MRCKNCNGFWCGAKYWVGTVMWLLAFAALVMAWIASTRPTGVFLQLPVAHLFWDALILGVLALGLKTSGACGTMAGCCDDCGDCHGGSCAIEEGEEEVSEEKEVIEKPQAPIARTMVSRRGRYQ